MRTLPSSPPDSIAVPKARTRLRPRPRLFVVVAMILAANAVLIVTRWETIERAIPGSTAGEVRNAVDRFFDDYVTIDGRVVRRDQGGDTVSEGQAYALLLSAATGEHARFELVWRWTRENLRREDGLFSWRWSDGSVVGFDPATDADLDAARALALAADRFSSSSYADEARRLSEAILEHEVMTIGGERVLLPGPWAADKWPVPIDPSYFSPRAYAALAGFDERWSTVRSSSYRILESLEAGADRLPPDWAVMTTDEVRPVHHPDEPSADPSFGFEAVRVLSRMAEDCTERGRRIAAGASSLLVPEEGGQLAFRYALDGRPIEVGRHPAMIVGAAASAHASGSHDVADALLDRAEEAEAERSSYYGAAWVALGRVMLQTELLGSCPAGG